MPWQHSLRTLSPRQGLALCAALLPHLLCAWTIELGDTRDDVLKAYGTPPSRMGTASRELFRYQEGELILEDGKVVEVRFRTAEPALLNPGFIKEARAAEEAAAAAAAEAEKLRLAEAEKARLAALVVAKQKLEIVTKETEEHRFWTNPFLWLGVGGALGGVGLYFWLYRRFKAQAEAATIVKPQIPVSHALDRMMRPSSIPHLAIFTRSHLDRIEWRVFDELVRNYLNTQGWVAKRVSVDGHGTTRSLLWKRNEARPSAYLCCMPAVGAMLSIDHVRQIELVLEEESLPEGFIVTTGDFTSEARNYTLRKRHVELVSGDALMTLLRNLPRKQHSTIVSQTLSGNYDTPSCPSCEIKMVLQDGPQPRWLCPQQPGCQRSFPAVKAVMAETLN